MLRLSLSRLTLASMFGLGAIALVIACGSGPSDGTMMDMGVDSSFPAPTVTAVAPLSAVNTAVTPITITGTEFRSGATVTVGGAPCTSVTVVSATSLTCTAPSKTGSCGFQDIVVTHPDDKKSGTGAKLFAYVSSGVVWAAPVDHLVGTYPRRVVTADFNGDGKLDLASANQIGNNVTVRLGAGDGTFPMAQSMNVPLGTGTAPMDLVAADLNADGKIDLATVNAGGSGSVTVLLNQGGSFASSVFPTNVGSFGSGTAIASGDLNADGKVDLAVSSSSSPGVLPMLGDGAGAFTSGTVRLVGGFTSDLALVDMDLDGKLDIVTANFSTHNVTVCLGLGGAMFGNPLNQNASTRPGGLFVTDLNGDKKPDVVAANNVGNSVSVLLGTGGGLLANPVDLPLDSNFPESVWVSDISNDGKPDIVTANNQTNNWSYLQAMNATQYAAPLHTATGTTPAGITVADLNGDGMRDIVVASAGTNNLQVTLQACK